MQTPFPTPGLTPTLESQATASKAKSSAKAAMEASARKAAADFESVFMTTLLEGMFAGVKTDGIGGGGGSEKAYRSMLLGEYAREISANGGLGIADHVYREIIAIQESSLK